MLNELQPDLRELIDLVRDVERYDSTATAAQFAGKPITPGPGSEEERRRKVSRIAHLRSKWNI